MPTYEYACRACGHRFETVQSMKDEPLTVCPECGGELRKVLHAAGIVFKGSGFYATDSRAKPPSKPTADQAKTADGAKDTSKPAKDTAADGGDGTKATSGSDGSGSKGPDSSGPDSSGPDSSRNPAKTGSSTSSSKGSPKKDTGS